jgi:hypothetical protein
MRTAKLKKVKKMKNKKSKRRRGGAELSQSYSKECRTPRCVSCRYFTIKAYLLRMGYTDDEINYIFGQYATWELHKLATQIDPLELKLDEQHDFLPIFITVKGGNITSPLHAFIIRRRKFIQKGKKRIKHTEYVVDSSWGQSRTATPEEYEEHRAASVEKGVEPQSQSDFDIDEIKHLPTTQGPFSSKELTEKLQNIPKNLQNLFGLTEDEFRCVEPDEFSSVDLFLFNPPPKRADA